MDIQVFSQPQLLTVFRVLRTALSPNVTLTSDEQEFLQVYAKITGFPLVLGDLRAIGADEVSPMTAHANKRLVQLAGMAVLLSRPVRKESALFLRDLARVLQVKDPVVKVCLGLADGRRLRARLITMRRGFKGMLKEAFISEGALGMVRFVCALFLGQRVNKDKTWNYKRLGLLPEGTLGREYWKHLTELGFGFPGEPAGIPETVAYHDIAHVLADNDTTPLGEIQQGSFQGGNRREDGFFFVQFVLLHFHHGIQITPAAPPQTGNFKPSLVLWAIHRGAACSVDMTHQWNFWPLMTLPLAEARARCELMGKLG